MTRAVVTIALTLVVLASACSRNAGLRCENPERYSDAIEVAPLRIPDDLDPPSEIEALRVPQTGATPVTRDSGGEGMSPDQSGEGDAAPCTEAPPDFFQEGLPG